MDKLDKKTLLDIFPEQGILIDKKLENISHNFKKLPKFVIDYLISVCCKNNVHEGITKINTLIENHLVSSNEQELIKSKIRNQYEYVFIGNIKCRYDTQLDQYFADLDAIGNRRIRIDPSIILRYQDILLTSGCWGSIKVLFDPSYEIGKKKMPFVITEFVPFKVDEINLNIFIDRRKQFTTDEWINLIISTIGFNPDEISPEEKLVFLYRLIPLVESNVNLVELGPPETGKTFCYKSLSSYSYVISGGKTTPATLFYDKLRRKIGVLGNKDCVVFDEVGNANWNNQDELISLMKDFMNSGSFGRGSEEFSSDCSVVFMGNINCNRKDKSIAGYYQHLFAPLPDIIKNDRAFLDRIHGYIPGWQACQISQNKFSQTHGFMCDYFSEIMHQLRHVNYSHLILEKVKFKDITQRNQNAIVKIASGLLKIIFPQATKEPIEDKELLFVINKAIDLRKIVIDQLEKISPGEFKNVSLEFEFK